jgi:hypothetical protein
MDFYKTVGILKFDTSTTPKLKISSSRAFYYYMFCDIFRLFCIFDANVS